jgi:hypothetical protein
LRFGGLGVRRLMQVGGSDALTGVLAGVAGGQRDRPRRRDNGLVFTVASLDRRRHLRERIDGRSGSGPGC